MKFCSITPLKNTDLMYEKEYVMLLAHLSQKSDYYSDYAKNHHNYKIMDNSIIELGSAFSMEDLVKEAIKCDVDEIILPDVFEDGEGTVKVVKESIDWLAQHNLIGRFKLMAVCHGRDPIELWSTFNELKEIDEVDVIGVPKVLSTWIQSRVLFAEMASSLTDKEVHLLGCWYNLSEIKEVSKHSGIRSMDTCLPALLSIYNMNAFDDRNGLKIDLEKDKVNLRKYYEILNNINLILK